MLSYDSNRLPFFFRPRYRDCAGVYFLCSFAIIGTGSIYAKSHSYISIVKNQIALYFLAIYSIIALSKVKSDKLQYLEIQNYDCIEDHKKLKKIYVGLFITTSVIFGLFNYLLHESHKRIKPSGFALIYSLEVIQVFLLNSVAQYESYNFSTEQLSLVLIREAFDRLQGMFLLQEIEGNHVYDNNIQQHQIAPEGQEEQVDEEGPEPEINLPAARI